MVVIYGSRDAVSNQFHRRRRGMVLRRDVDVSGDVQRWLAMYICCKTLVSIDSRYERGKKNPTYCPNDARRIVWARLGRRRPPLLCQS